MGFTHKSYSHLYSDGVNNKWCDWSAKYYAGEKKIRIEGLPVSGISTEASIPPFPESIVPLDWATPSLLKIPTGSKNLEVKIVQTCSIHPSCLTAIHASNGKLLVGAPLRMAPFQRLSEKWTSLGYSPATMIAKEDPLELIPSDPSAYASFYDMAAVHLWFGYPSLLWGTDPCTDWWNLSKSNLSSSVLSTSYLQGNMWEAYDSLYAPNPTKTKLGLKAIFPHQYGETAMEYANWTARPATDIPPEYDSRMCLALSQVYRDLFPTIFPSGFTFDDSEVNGTGEYFIRSDTSLKSFTVDSENIRWTGSERAGTNTQTWANFAWEKSGGESQLLSNNSESNPYEVLEIDEVQSTIIVLISSGHYYTYTAEWDNNDDPPPDPEPPEEPEPAKDMCIARPRFFRSSKDNAHQSSVKEGD